MKKIIAVIALLVGFVIAVGGVERGKIDSSNSIYFTSDGIPYQCGPMSYYGALCWRPDGVPNAPHSVKGFMWVLVPVEK